MQYFKKTYIGISATGRRPAKAATFSRKLWNQRDAALNGGHKTNNVSEGWHNSFRFFMGKNHPDLFPLLNKVLKEQVDTDISLTELALDRKIKGAPKEKWIYFQHKI